MIPRPDWYVRGQFYEFNRMRQGGQQSNATTIPTGVVVTSKFLVFDTITIPTIAIAPATASGSGVRVQWGLWNIDPLVGHPLGAPIAQTGPFAPTPLSWCAQALRSSVTLTPGCYARGMAVSAAAGNFFGTIAAVEVANDQGNSSTVTTQGWSTPWTYSATGLPTFTSGLTWTAQTDLPGTWGLAT